MSAISLLQSAYKHLQSNSVYVCVCVRERLRESEARGVDSHYPVCAMPNTSSIFVYSSALLFSHRTDEKDAHIKHIAFGRRGGTHIHAVLQNPPQ